jgi:preprotein translocase subunit SecF
LILSTSAPIDATEITKLVRDELDRYNKYLEFAQGQIDKDRSFFKHLYTLAAAFIAVLVAAAGFFSYSSVSQMRADMKASVDAELERDKREITSLTSAGKDAVNEAKTKTTQEMENVRVEVKKEIDKEFRSDNVADLVRSSAKERTEQELEQVIRSEVSTQVANGIKDQGPEISNDYRGSNESSGQRT